MIFKKKRQHHIQAIILSGVIISAVFVIVVMLLIKSENINLQEDDVFSPFAVQNGQDLSSDAVATLGQQYIKTLASYDLAMNAPVLLNHIEIVSAGAWLARYEVEQMDPDGVQVYNYLINIVNGRVVLSHSSVMDKSRKLLVSNPEPEQVVSGSRLLVKGQAYPAESDNFNTVTIEVFNNLKKKIITKLVDIGPEDNYFYLGEIRLPNYESGEMMMVVSTGEIKVAVPFVAASNQ